ncbi:MAG: squalene/phytoene synthase family protein, partial [Anaerolineae bacterium]|nr:squalene/phytoene synthase family protein [Anaerolineae bacterium]
DDPVDEAAGNAAGDSTAEALTRRRQRAVSECVETDDLLTLAWHHTQERFGIPSRYAEQLIDGVACDLTHNRYTTFTDLTAYCYGASTVGLMAMHIIGFAGPEAIPHAVKLGMALQLTNILRDVAEDWRLGRLYLPLEELDAYGLSEKDIALGQVNARWRAFMRFQIARVRQLYAESLPGVNLLHQDGRFAIGAAAELYRAILEDIEAHNFDVFHRRAYLGQAGKLRRLPGIAWRSLAHRYRPRR